MRTPLALLVCLLLSGLAAPVVCADALAPPDDTQKTEEGATQPEPLPPGTTPDVSPPPGSEKPVVPDTPARPSWSLGVVAILAMSVLIFVYLRRQHTLPDDSSVDAKA